MPSPTTNDPQRAGLRGIGSTFLDLALWHVGPQVRSQVSTSVACGRSCGELFTAPLDASVVFGIHGQVGVERLSAFPEGR